MASVSPRPVSARRSARRSCCRGVRPPTTSPLGTVRPSTEYPWCRAISSTTSISIAESYRHGGITTSTSSPAAVVLKPIGSSSSAIRAGASSSPRIDATRWVRTRTTGRNGGSSPSATARPSSSRAPLGASSWAKRRMARSMTSGSVPFTKRADASDASLRRRDDFTIPIGWNHAISRSTSVVASSISLLPPPMIPARPTGCVGGVADEEVVGGEGAIDLVEGGELLAVAGPPDPEPGTRHLGQVVGVVGLAQLEHHVVRDVDHVVDRPHAERGEASGDGGIAGADLHAPQHACLEAAAQVGVEDLDRDALDRVGRDQIDGGLRQRERQPQAGGQVAGHAGHRHRVGTVGVDLEVVDDVRLDAHRLGERGARLEVRREQEDAGVVVAETELAWTSRACRWTRPRPSCGARSPCRWASRCRRWPAGRGRRPTC